MNDENYHGCPSNRGAADAWYNRGPNPHKYPQGTYNGDPVTLTDPEEIAAYNLAYAEGMASGEHKDWN